MRIRAHLKVVKISFWSIYCIASYRERQFKRSENWLSTSKISVTFFATSIRRKSICFLLVFTVFVFLVASLNKEYTVLVFRNSLHKIFKLKTNKWNKLGTAIHNHNRQIFQNFKQFPQMIYERHHIISTNWFSKFSAFFVRQIVTPDYLSGITIVSASRSFRTVM